MCTIDKSNIIIYLKTTDTCQLNCSHCFTNGSNGKKIYFDKEKTINWFAKLKTFLGNDKGGHIAFHGGEPMLANIKDMIEVYDDVSAMFPKIWWSITTNLVYPLTEEKINFFKTVCNGIISTSWDYYGRFDTKREETLWEDNVKKLRADNIDITVQVCLTNPLLENMRPNELIDKMINLNIPALHLERLTIDGNAVKNKDTLSVDLETQDLWLEELFHYYKDNKLYEKIKIPFFDSLLSAIVYGTHSGCRCRQCEKRIFTINANGTIGGCPNTAVTKVYGSIDNTIESILTSPDRLVTMASEDIRDPRCYACEVFEICNGDCHQLTWDENENHCPGPKLVIKAMLKEDDEVLKEMLQDFIGEG